MHIKFTLLMLVFSAYYYSLSAQYYNQQEHFLKANSVWVFGQRAGLDFNQGSRPVPIETSIISVEACASVSDSNGQLLFYLGSHGMVWNRTHNPMLNGTGLYPYHPLYYGSSSAQGVAIVPVIDTPWKYYIFINTPKETYVYGTSPPTLTYSVIDMTLDNGLGGIEQGRKNIPLYNYGLHEGMIAVPGDNCDIWLMTLSSYFPLMALDPNIPDPRDTQYFLAWHITRDGIDPTPVISNPHPALSEHSDYGTCMSVSPDRQRIALGLRKIGKDRDRAGALLCKFDPASGKVFDGIMLPLSTGRAGGYLPGYATCFSPDNTKLYANMGPGWHTLQYDIKVYDSAKIMSSEYRVTTRGNYGPLKLYKDTIYSHAYTRRDILYRITRPNDSAEACGLDSIGTNFVPGTYATHSFSNEVVFPISKQETSIAYDTICHTRTTGHVSKTLSVPEDYAIYEWDDGTTGHTREVSTAGTYWVKYRNHHSCMTYVDSFVVDVIDLNFSLGADTKVLFCDHPQSYLPLKVGISDNEVGYRWQDGSNDREYRVTEPGVYWVEVSKGKCVASDTIKIEGTEELAFSDTIVCNDDIIDITLYTPDVPIGTVIQWSTGSSAPSIHVTDTGLYWVSLINPPCVLTDSAHVNMEYCECFAHMPNAFSPNGDGLNDVFVPMIDYNCPVQGYVLTIYNRFGERIFYSTDLSRGWDGLHNGRPIDVGVYFYEVYFTGGTRERKFYYKGDVSLIR